MGDFAKKVRQGQIKGPSQRGFKAKDWQVALEDGALDPEDAAIVQAGLLFGSLFDYLRGQWKYKELGLPLPKIARIAIALANRTHWLILKTTKVPGLETPGKRRINLSEFQQLQVTLPNGQVFAPDEIGGSSGDALKMLLRDCLAGNPPARNEYFIPSNEEVAAVVNEFHIGQLYNSAVEYWHDCLSHGYAISPSPEGDLRLRPQDQEREKSRVASNHRRIRIASQDMFSGDAMWRYEFPDAMKRELCDTKLVVSATVLFDRIDRIDLGLNREALNRSSQVILERYLIAKGYYGAFLNETLPDLGNISLTHVLRGWQVLQSLSEALHREHMKMEISEDTRENLIGFAPVVSQKVLHATLRSALKKSDAVVDCILRTLTFSNKPTADIWSQPLVRLGDDFCLAIACINAVQLLRLVEGWMRQGGFILDRRGVEFETYCRDDLKSYINGSPIEKITKLVSTSVEYKPQNERAEEIDLVVFIGNTVLLVEAKCILWPDESVQYANYRETIVAAATQVTRKKESVERNYQDFKARMKQLGYTAPESPSVVACVLTNSAVYAGFPINGVPVVDLPILGKFFENEHIVKEVKARGKTIGREAIKFYSNSGDAPSSLIGYLLDPPQLARTKHSVINRELVYPVSPGGHRLIHETFEVKIDGEDLEKFMQAKEESLPT